jgi:ADP-heptose:LPS heptosyltransferase
MGFLNKYPDTMVITVGEMLCELLEASHPRLKSYSGKWDIRKSLIMTKYSDLAISPETAVASAVGCFKTPKIIMLSHSSAENLTKYWDNCKTIFSYKTKCYPCHKMHYTLETCETLSRDTITPDTPYGTPDCMEKISPGMLFQDIEEVYFKWKEKK